MRVFTHGRGKTALPQFPLRLFLKGFETPSGRIMSEFPSPASPKGPVDQRKTMCSEKARQSRYDPASETAVLKSPYLEPRKVVLAPQTITLGGIDSDPSPAWSARAFTPRKIPIPIKRPKYGVVSVDGEELGSSSLRGTLPVPSKSPIVKGAPSAIQ